MKRIFIMLLMAAFFSVAAMPDKITGRIMDDITGKGLGGVIVSNGAESVCSGEDGSYALPRHAATRFVTVAMPADRDAESFYRRITTSGDVVNYDFRLRQRPKFDSFRFVQISDTECEGSRDIPPIYDRIRRFARNCGAAFLIHTGDIHTPADQQMHAREVNRQNFGLPVYYTLGNHDHKSDGRGEKCFEETLGPLYYAFEEGNVLFVVLPMYGIYDRKPGFTGSDVAKFFHNLMKLVLRDRPVIIVSHFPENLSADGVVGGDTPYPTDLKQWNVKGWLHGHTHYSRVLELPCGIRLFNCAISTKGGIGGDAAAYRYYHVAPDGMITSRIVPMFADNLLSVQISPTADDGLRTVAAACTDASSLVTGVSITITNTAGGSETPALTRRGPWLWTAHYPFGENERYAIRVVAALNSGETIIREAVFPAPPQRTATLELERIAWLPGQVLMGKPAFGEGMIFAGTNDDENGTESAVFALDAGTGKIRWKYSTPAGIRNAVLYNNGIVYAADADHNIYALRAADGTLSWKSAAGLSHLNHFNCNRIALADGVLYGGAGYYLRALDAAGGKELWRNQAFGQWNMGTDTPLIIAGKAIVSNPGPRNPVRALNAADGKPVWEMNLKKHLTRPTVTALPDGKLLLAARYYSAIVEAETGRILLTMPEKNTGDSYLERGSTSKPVVYNDMIIIGTEWRGLAAFDRHTLKYCWDSVRSANAPGNSLIATAPYRRSSRCVDSDPVLIGNQVVFAGLDGVLYECAAADGKPAGKIVLGAPVTASPLVANNRLYLADYAGRLFIFKLKP